ncbi:MAG: ATP-binding cassette domain-containing protein, partial [Burkholderiales bacterium]|nr:ATP-binding cassette domain-containing protein [Burkholderiales bacterium]
ITQYTFNSLRQQIGLVSQDTFLIDGSIADNIAYGSFNAPLTQIIKAAQIARIDNFINSLPNQYDTQIGENGQKLSGGQRQRIALARAILKNPAVLILDEATSSLDNHTESLIQEALESIKGERTTIVIAHRLSTIINADQIYVIEKGIIAEQGNHTQLLDKAGIYANLWNLQLHQPSLSD